MTRDNVTIVVMGTSYITVTGLAAELVFQCETIVLRPALVAVTPDHIPFAGTGTSLLVATIAQ